MLDFEKLANPLLEALRPWNTHWTGSAVSELLVRHPDQRAAVPHLVEALLEPRGRQWTLLAGPRQTGKTTSLGHVAAILIEGNGVPPRSVAVAPLDQPKVQEAFGDDIDDLISALSTLHTPTRDAPLFLLLDEIQEIPGWAKRLKAAWDRHHLAIRVLATGSSAMNLIRPADADFAGRILTRTLHPMKFREVVSGHPELAMHCVEPVWPQIVALARDSRALVGNPAKESELRESLVGLHEAISSSSPSLEAFLRRIFVEYAVWGGYPGARPGTTKSVAERLDVFEQAWNALLAKDIPSLGIAKIREFGMLFREIAGNPGGKFVPGNLSRRLGPQWQTLAEWKRILEDAMLVQQLGPLKPNLRPTRGKEKAYLLDPGWHAYVRGITDASQVSSESVFGLLVETVLTDHVRRLQFNLVGTTSLASGYVEEPEIDIVADLGRRWLLLEAKYRAQPRGILNDFPEPEKSALRIVATREYFEIPRGRGTYYVPAHELALIC